ncbi:TPM domain-containing protein [Mucilaginibacter limnophilus]|uniref:TPM domain-containing protein n=1 Tax=Mucilaginibacter limnophilus TaxID=1932778 RepID=A0A437MKZ6_9SPHI|nr:TPM domain-containing protein [Mucilaginibacter limnophilus]RVT98276.1 TPM domain-containing protein [Mucilaginibacter limnophilus]
MLKKYIVVISLLLTGIFAFGQEFPEKPNKLVNDYADVLSPEQEQQLSAKVEAFADSTSTSIAIVTMKSVGDYDIGDYALQLGRKWGVGQSGKNNGIMILAAINDRKLTIQTGYGVEGALPDAITRRIREEDMNPRFREGDFYDGFDAAVDDIIKYTKGEYKAEPKKQGKQNGGGGSVGFIIIIVIFILILVFRNRGGGGGGGRIIDRRGGASPFWWFLAGNMLGGGGRSSGGWGGFSGGGGGWGGGGSSGFGGGSFGGGGSSGSW